MSKEMIRLIDLTKRYGSFTALNNLDLTVNKGELFGLLGPNGAGKTTLLRLLTTLTAPDEGRIIIDGSDVSRDLVRVKNIIGVVSQHNNLDQELTVEENLAYGGLLFNMPYREARLRAAEMLEFFDLVSKRKTRARVLSGGEKRKAMLARALMHKPQLLFLDEPTVGLDPVFRKKMWNYIKQLNIDGMTILLTTHYIEEAEALCEKICLLDSGSLIGEGAPADLIASLGRFTVEYFEGGSFRYRFFRSRSEAQSYSAAIEGRVTVRKTNLEDVFFRLTGRKAVEIAG